MRQSEALKCLKKQLFHLKVWPQVLYWKEIKWIKYPPQVPSPVQNSVISFTEPKYEEVLIYFYVCTFPEKFQTETRILSPSSYEELFLGCLPPNLGVEVHGEEGAGTVEDGGHGAHERG